MWDSKRETDVKNGLLDSVGEGEGGMIWDGSVEMCILSYVKWIAGPGSMHETGCSGLVHWMGNTCVPMADSCQCMAKTTTVL